jgi:hypothetical protein
LIEQKKKGGEKTSRITRVLKKGPSVQPLLSEQWCVGSGRWEWSSVAIISKLPTIGLLTVPSINYVILSLSFSLTNEKLTCRVTC